MKLKLTPETFILQQEINYEIDQENEQEKVKQNLSENNLSSGNQFANLIKSKKIDPLQTSPSVINYSIYLLNNYKSSINNQRKLVKREILQADIRNVVLTKDKSTSSFGLSIRGGCDYKRPLIISCIQHNSVADKCKSIFLGDLILEVNNQCVYPLNLTHEQAMKLIKSNSNRLQLTLKHLNLYNKTLSCSWQKQLDACWCNECTDKQYTKCYTRNLFAQVQNSQQFKESNKENKSNPRYAFANDEGFCTYSNGALSSSENSETSCVSELNHQNFQCSNISITNTTNILNSTNQIDRSNLNSSQNLSCKSENFNDRLPINNKDTENQMNKSFDLNDNKENHFNFQTNFCNKLNSSCSLSLQKNKIKSSKSKLRDIVSVNLINCYFTKYIHNTDNIRKNGMEVTWFNQKKCFVNSAVISFTDQELAQKFQNQIHFYVSRLNESYMFNFNRGLDPNRRIFFMGWVSLAFTNKNEISFELSEVSWQPKYMIIKGGELLLYDQPPQYLIDNLNYENDTSLEFEKLSDLLVSSNGKFNCNIVLEKNRPSFNSNQSQSKHSSIKLTRHLSMKKSFKEKKINRSNSTTGTFGKNSAKKIDEKKSKQDPNYTLPRNNLLNNDQTQSNKTLRRSSVASNLSDENNSLPKDNQNKPIVYKAYQSILRQLRSEEQLDRRENCLIALSSYSKSNSSSILTNHLIKSKKPASMSTLRRHQNQNKTIISNIDDLNSNQIDEIDYQLGENNSYTPQAAYLSVEYPNNIEQIIQSWIAATLYSVKQISKKAFMVISEGKFYELVLDWKQGFTLYDPYAVQNSCKFIKWNYKFSQLKTSSDDGRNTLWLSFQTIQQKSNFVDTNQSTCGSLSSVDSLEKMSSKLSNTSLNRTTFLGIIKKSIETKELICENLKNVLYCMHAFLSAKVTSVSANLQTSTFRNSKI